MLENTQKWFNIANEDLDMANIAFQHGRYLHMMFFGQQALEKALKGLYFEKCQQTPPRKHDLLSLAASCKILDELSLERKNIFCHVI